MRKIIAYLATSADGFIARLDGQVDWLDRPSPRGAYGMPAFLTGVDTVVMGRNTYEVGKALGGALTPGKRNIVLSHTLPMYAVPGGIVESGTPEELARKWRGEKGNDIWLMGGAVVFGAFLDAGLLDELIVHVMPVLIGDGIPLLDAKPRLVELSLRSTRRFADGVVRVHYAIDSKVGNES